MSGSAEALNSEPAVRIVERLDHCLLFDYANADPVIEQEAGLTA
jgi:hypothetical protein